MASRRPVLRAIGLRTLQAVLVLFVLITLTFFLIKALPGGPFTQEKAIPAHVKERLMEYYGLQEPVWEQFRRNLLNLGRGDLGVSLRLEGRPVADILLATLPVSLTLGMAAMAVALGIGIPAGILAAAHRNSMLDHTTMALALTGICVPAFVIGPVLTWMFSLQFPVLPAAGWPPISPLGWVLPAITLGLAYAAYIGRLTRAGMLEVLGQDFVRTARAKGLPEFTILTKHCLRGGLVPVVAYLGPAFAAIVSGSIIVESLFMVPGMGNQLVKAIEARDAPMIQGLVVLYGSLTLLANLAADILLVWINPRLRS